MSQVAKHKVNSTRSAVVDLVVAWREDKEPYEWYAEFFCFLGCMGESRVVFHWTDQRCHFNSGQGAGLTSHILHPHPVHNAIALLRSRLGLLLKTHKLSQGRILIHPRGIFESSYFPLLSYQLVPQVYPKAQLTDLIRILRLLRIPPGNPSHPIRTPLPLPLAPWLSFRLSLSRLGVIIHIHIFLPLSPRIRFCLLPFDGHSCNIFFFVVRLPKIIRTGFVVCGCRGGWCCPFMGRRAGFGG